MSNNGNHLYLISEISYLVSPLPACVACLFHLKATSTSRLPDTPTSDMTQFKLHCPINHLKFSSSLFCSSPLMILMIESTILPSFTFMPLSLKALCSNSDKIRYPDETKIKTAKDTKATKKHESRSKGPGFVDLVDDVIQIICSELRIKSRASLLALAQVSPTLNTIVMLYIFQNLLLPPGPEGSHQRKANEVLLQRLRGQTGSKLLKYVRHICVDEFESIASLEAIMEKCQNIRTLR